MTGAHTAGPDAGGADGAGFVALIPARLASTRLPNKPLADLAGKPMVVRVAELARASGARLVAVATDSDAVAGAVREHGFQALLTRADHPTGTDRLAQAVSMLGLEPEQIVVNVQGDEPLLPTQMIRDVAAALAADDGCSIATAAHPIDDAAEFLNPNVVKVVLDGRRRALYFSRAPIPWDRDRFAPLASARPTQLPDAMTARRMPLRHVGLYAYRCRFLTAFPALPPSVLEQLESLEQLRALHHGHAISVVVVPGAPPAGVDTPEDLERVRKILESRAPKGP